MTNETKDKKSRARGTRKASTKTTDFLGQKRAEMAAKAAELDKTIKTIQKDLNSVATTQSVLAEKFVKMTNERDRVVAGIAAIDRATGHTPTPTVEPASTASVPRTKLTQETADAIRAAEGTLRAIGETYGVSRTTVANIKSGRQWPAKS